MLEEASRESAKLTDEALLSTFPFEALWRSWFMHLAPKASSFHIPLFPLPLHFSLSLSPFSRAHSLVFLHLTEERDVLLEPWRGTICHVLQIMSLSSSALSPHAFLYSHSSSCGELSGKLCKERLRRDCYS